MTERAEDLAPPNSYDVRITADDVRLPEELVGEIDPTGWLKPKVDRLTVIGHAALAEPIALRPSRKGRSPALGDAARGGFEWGEMKLVVSGSFEVDDQGYPEGSIKVEAREWRQMVRSPSARASSIRDTADTIRTAIEFVTALTGSGDKLSAAAEPLGRQAAHRPLRRRRRAPARAAARLSGRLPRWTCAPAGPISPAQRREEAAVAETADVIIIGAGVIGAATAFELAKRG